MVHVIKRIQHSLGGSVYLREDRDFDLRRIIRMNDRILYNAGLVEERIIGEIFLSI